VNYLIEDPFPGRCGNYRYVNGQTLRCLDYELTPHICTFPNPREYPINNAAQGITYTRDKPARWVKP